MATHSDHWAVLRNDRRWGDLWAHVQDHGTDDDIYRLVADMTAAGDLRDAEAMAHAMEAFKQTAKGRAMHRRNVLRAEALVAADR